MTNAEAGYAGEERPVTSKFKVGDDVYLKGTIAQVDDGDSMPWKVAFATEDDWVWCSENAPVVHAHALTKERDDAREQLARVCAQVESQAAIITRIQKERDEFHDWFETACAGERSADAEVERLRALLNGRSKDARILDCVATLLAMRGES